MKFSKNVKYLQYLEGYESWNTELLENFQDTGKGNLSQGF